MKRNHLHMWMGVVASVAAANAEAQVVFSPDLGGDSGLFANSIYEANFNLLPPPPLGGGPGMGLGAGDNIDAASSDKDDTDPDFVPCFSVDPTSSGSPLPFRAPFTSFTVFDQASKNQVEGDLFSATEAFNRVNGLLPVPISLGLNSNELIANQSPTYPNEMSLLPLANPADFVFPKSPRDNVNAETMLEPGSSAMIFSLSANSPSIQSLGGTSGADLFFDPNITVGGNEQIYATFAQLGLLQQDDIASVAYYDSNNDNQYNGIDTVYFTLTRTSPTLGPLGLSAADVLVSSGGMTRLFISHSILGLQPTDAIDAVSLDTLIAGSVFQTIRMKICPADLNGDGQVDVLDFFAFVVAFGTGNPIADLDMNGQIDVLDYFAFIVAFLAGCP